MEGEHQLLRGVPPGKNECDQKSPRNTKTIPVIVHLCSSALGGQYVPMCVYVEGGVEGLHIGMS